MNKKIANKIALGLILLLIVGIGVIFWLQNKKEEMIIRMPATSIQQPMKDSGKINSDYGFNFSVPAGWHIWEGNSSASDLMDKTDFGLVLESGMSALTNQKVKEYQTFMDNWKAESSGVIVFTNSQTLDYKNRSFSDAGKIMSRIVDSENTLKQREITMYISTAEVNLKELPVNDEKREIRNIKINGKDANLAISKNMELVDWIIIRMPINSNETISGKKVSSLFFMEYVKKNNPNGSDELISFISSLGISDNQ